MRGSIEVYDLLELLDGLKEMGEKVKATPRPDKPNGHHVMALIKAVGSSANLAILFRSKTIGEALSHPLDAEMKKLVCKDMSDEPTWDEMEKTLRTGLTRILAVLDEPQPTPGDSVPPVGV